MHSYVLLLLVSSYLPYNNTGKVLRNITRTIVVNSTAHTIIPTTLQPQQKAIDKNKAITSVSYKQYVMGKGEGLWQVAAKNHVAKKNMLAWILLVAKKNKLREKDNNNNYVLYEGDVIWIPL